MLSLLGRGSGGSMLPTPFRPGASVNPDQREAEGSMRTRAVRLLVCVALAHSITVVAAATDTRPFKVGTFDAQGRVFIGAVLDDSVVIDINAAAAALQRPAASPRDMRDLIARYENGVRDLIVAAASSASGSAHRSARSQIRWRVRSERHQLRFGISRPLITAGRSRNLPSARCTFGKLPMPTRSPAA